MSTIALWTAGVTAVVAAVASVLAGVWGGQVADRQTKALGSAQRELVRRVGPRHLDRGQFLAALRGQPKAPVEVMYYRDDAECLGLAQEIAQSLEASGWTVVSRRPIPLTMSDIPTAMTVGGQPSGVTVVAHAVSAAEAEALQHQMMGQPWEDTPWTALYHALTISLGQTSGSGGGPNSPPPGQLRIVVASKPSLG